MRLTSLQCKSVCYRASSSSSSSPFNYYYFEFSILIASGLFGIVLLMMVASTGYDIFCTVYKCKFQYHLLFRYVTFGFHLWKIMNFVEGVKYQPFIVFSVHTNGQKLFSCVKSGTSSGTIECIEGIRVLSIASIVFLHVHQRYTDRPLHDKNSYYEVIVSSALNKFNSKQPFQISSLSNRIVVWSLLQR